MQKHKFKVGQTVRLLSGAPFDRTGGIYQILRVMPYERGEFSYRIKSSNGGGERAVTEAMIEVAFR